MPVSLSPSRSENFAKMPPIGVASPAPRTIWIGPPFQTNTPPGTALPSTAAANATVPSRLIDGGPKPAKVPPAGARSPWATTFCSLPPVERSSAAMFSRPRRTVARNTMLPRALIAGASSAASVPEATPGAGPPLRAIGRRRPPRAAKMPSTALPPATAAAKATVPSSLRAGAGCLLKPDRRPTPSTRSPSRATALMRPRDHRNSPSSESPRPSVEKNATSPRALTGATIGIDSAPKRSKIPPPGAASPVVTTWRSGGDCPAAVPSVPATSAVVSRPRRPSWRQRMRGSIGRLAGSRNDDDGATRAPGPAAARRRRHRRDHRRARRATPGASRGVLLPRRRNPALHEQSQRGGLPPALRRGALRRLVLEGAAALLELGLRRVASSGYPSASEETHGAQDRLHPHRGRSLLPRVARRSHPGRGARLRLRVDGGASLGHQPLLALAAAGAGRLRHPHVAADARHGHPRGRLLSPGAPGRGRGAARRDVQRPLHPRDRHRLQARRVRALRRRSGEARRPLRGAARDHEGAVDRRAGGLPRHLLHGRGTPRAQAGDEAAPAGVDRRLGRHHAATGRHAGRQL